MCVHACVYVFYWGTSTYHVNRQVNVFLWFPRQIVANCYNCQTRSLKARREFEAAPHTPILSVRSDCGPATVSPFLPHSASDPKDQTRSSYIFRQCLQAEGPRRDEGGTESEHVSELPSFCLCEVTGMRPPVLDTSFMMKMWESLLSGFLIVCF